MRSVAVQTRVDGERAKVSSAAKIMTGRHKRGMKSFAIGLCTVSELLPWAVEMMIKEIGSSVVAGEPVAMKKKIVDFVGENELFDLDVAFGAQAGNEIDGLREVNVAIVVAVDKEHRRFPGVDCGDRRRVVRELGQIRGNILAIPVVGRPSWTPWISTPAAKVSELRPSPSAVR